MEVIPTEPQIESPTPADAEAMHEISTDGWHDNFVQERWGITLERLVSEFKITRDNQEAIAGFRESIEKSDTAYFVVKSGGKVIGWAAVENLESNQPKWIDIYVARDARGQGVGEKLMNHLLTQYGNLELHLAVPVTSRAREFYQRFGFIGYVCSWGNKHGLRVEQMRRLSNA